MVDSHQTDETRKDARQGDADGDVRAPYCAAQRTICYHPRRVGHKKTPSAKHTAFFEVGEGGLDWLYFLKNGARASLTAALIF